MSRVIELILALGAVALMLAGMGAYALVTTVGAPTGGVLGMRSSPSVPAPPPNRVVTCGPSLCLGGKTWFMHGASVYEAIHNPAPSGIDNPDGTVALAAQAKLNTIRIVNFYDSNKGNPDTEPFSETQWRKVDTLVAAVGAADMHVLLDLSDYRNILWHDCINPYGYDWGRYLTFVASRKNTVTGATYGSDPHIALVAMAGEPQKPGSYPATSAVSQAACSISYSGSDLTEFYHRTLAEWRKLAKDVPAFTGGLGYLNFNSGIDWRSIFDNPDNAVCGIKTYGRMIDFVPTASAECGRRQKPWIDEEFGWQQSTPDASRAEQFHDTYQALRNNHAAGALFWNLGYEVAPQSYEVNPTTPAAFGAVQAAAP